MSQNNVSGQVPQVPAWNARAKVRKATPSGVVVAGEYVFGGEVFRVSPRYQKNGSTFRIRPERPAIAFAAWAVESGLLPLPLTAAEAESAEGMAILAQLFAAYKDCFKGLEPAVQSGDANAQPDLLTGFSFLVPQPFVEKIGFASTASTSGMAPVVNTDLAAEMTKRIEEMRAKAAAAQEAPKKPGKKS